MNAKRSHTFKLRGNGIKGRKLAPLKAVANDSIELIFKILERNGDTSDLSAFDVTFNIATMGGSSALVEKTESAGISVSGNVVTVDFKADNELENGGKFYCQLVFTNGSDSFVVAEFDLILDVYIK